MFCLREYFSFITNENYFVYCKYVKLHRYLAYVIRLCRGLVHAITEIWRKINGFKYLEHLGKTSLSKHANFFPNLGKIDRSGHLESIWDGFGHSKYLVIQSFGAEKSIMAGTQIGSNSTEARSSSGAVLDRSNSP